MPHRIDRQGLQADLGLPWLIVVMAAVVLAAIVLVCQILGADLQQQPFPEATREWIRTVLYGIGIVAFPFTNLLRHVQLRLNQTMPIGNVAYGKVAKKRYLQTVVVSVSLIQSPGLYGLIMFLLGDPFNTLIIFTLMSALGLYLYRPKLDEYERLMVALANQNHE
ncbi:MAG: hypothetical protein CTY16_11890 [Methylobacter sp.]|nr:MAG: hypothetical protein CTY16_11890 [Methylobacter sp.]